MLFAWLVGSEKMERLHIGVLKKENFTCGAAVAILLTRLRSGAAWLPKGNAKAATCFSRAEFSVSCMVAHLGLRCFFWIQEREVLSFCREGLVGRG